MTKIVRDFLAAAGIINLSCIISCKLRQADKLCLNPSNAEATFVQTPKHKESKNIENHLNLVMLVFIG